MRENMYEEMYIIEEAHWWFHAKRDIVMSMINADPSARSFIDFGCGTGIMLESLSRYGKVTGIDFSAKALEFCGKRLDSELIQLDLTKELTLENKYDIGVALDVLEHLDDDLTALQNMKNVLRRNGRLIITVPAFAFLWSAHDENCEHKRRYSVKELKKLTLNAGFEIEYLSYYNSWLFPMIACIRIVSRLLKIDKNSDMENEMPGKLINTVLYHIFKSEVFFIKKRIRLPFGVSAIAILK